MIWLVVIGAILLLSNSGSNVITTVGKSIIDLKENSPTPAPAEPLSGNALIRRDDVASTATSIDTRIVDRVGTTRRL